MYFSHLPNIIPHTDAAFESFYDVMLKEPRLAVHFEDDAQIRRLIEMQKQYFIASIAIHKSDIRDTYVALGERHHTMKIPYADFAKGTEILQEHFVLKSLKSAEADALIADIFEYFKMIRAYTAKGYLNRMLEEDIRDINLFTEKLAETDQTYLPVTITLNKIRWLSGLLDALQNDGDWSERSQECLKTWKEELKHIPANKRRFIKEMEERIVRDTQNLFYLLEKEEYTEILPLYTSLLAIYKLAFVMNNALTIEYASKTINEMKLDQLTLLYRKDQFEMGLRREMEQAERDPDYRVSVALIDIDDFKSINDTYGHMRGDNVLETLGNIIRKHTRRRSDMGFRIGGDEIAVIFKNASADEAARVCAEIRERLACYAFASKEQSFGVTLSIGIKAYDARNKEDFEAFFNALDRNLYTAKARGKDRIVH